MRHLIQLTVVPGKQQSSSVIRILVLLVVVPFTIYLLSGAISPPTDFDVREYHLQGPKEWFQQGQITFLPHNVYTSFPFLTEMLSLTGMIFTEDWWRGALVGQIVLSTFQVLSALSVFSIARRWICRRGMAGNADLSDNSVDTANLADRLRRRFAGVLSDLLNHVCASGLAGSRTRDPAFR